MTRSRRLITLLLGWCFAIATPAAFAQDILDHVPTDALALVIVRDLAGVRSQISRFTDPNAPNPLIDLFPESLINTTIGNNPGLDSRGDLLFVAHASERPLIESPLSVWLPVRDYDAFVRALGGNPQDRIGVITVQGQDMLCAKLDRWALIMDATERERLNAVLNGLPNAPPRAVAWREMFTKNSIAVGLFPTDATRRSAREWMDSAKTSASSANVRTVEDLFRAMGAGAAGNRDSTALGGQWSKFVAASPRLVALVLETDALAAGIRIENGNFLASLRLAWPEDKWQSTELAAVAPTLHREGEFTFSGGGALTESLCRAVAEHVARSSVGELRGDDPRRTFDPILIEKFLTECQAAAALVRGVAIFHSPGGDQLAPPREDQDGVYTNQLLALRVESPSNFAAQVNRVCDAWNDLNARARPVSNLVFERQETTIAGKPAVDYSLDIAAADESRHEPSMRQLMVRLFGPDRKLHRFVVPADDHTVLVASATADQVASALKFLKDSTKGTWLASNTAISNQLTSESAAWKVFFSPAGYVKWVKRANDVTMGEVVGAVPLDPFPVSPPVAFAGSFAKNELTVELAVPGDTLRNAQAYRLLRSQRARAAR